MHTVEMINYIIMCLFFACYVYQFLYIPVAWLPHRKRGGTGGGSTDGGAPGNAALAAALGGMLLGGTPIQAAAQSPIPRPAQSEPIGRDAMLDLSGEARRLITEDDVRRAAQRGYRIIRYAPDAILTPLARDIAAEKRIELASAVH